MRDLIRRLFPNLQEDEFVVTSPRDERYNCVAWAAGDTQRWWWPGETPFSFWPKGVPREESVAVFVEAFSTLGYEVTASPDHEAAYERVAIFTSADGVPTHMARQLDDGSWTSKLGALEDITHIHVSGVAGSEYGNVMVVLRRAKTSSAAVGEM